MERKTKLQFEFRDSQSIKWELYESSEPVNSFTSALELPNQSWKEVTTRHCRSWSK